MDSDMEETELSQIEEEDSEMEEEEIPKPRGRPAGKADSSQRYRRTAAEISEDKN